LASRGFSSRSGERGPVTRLRSSAPVVVACFRVSLSKNLGRPLSYVLPVRPRLSPDPRVFSSPSYRALTSECLARLLLSCTSTPPQRLAPALAALLPASPADPEPPSKSASQKLRDPSASSGLVALLCTTPAEVASDRLGVTHRKPRPQGLATLSTASAHNTLEGLFQPPTLSGFPLQSFPPLRGSIPGLPGTLRSCASLQNHYGLAPALQRLPPPGKAVPLFAPRTVNSGRGPCSPGLTASRALPPGNQPKRVSRLGSPPALRSSTTLRS